MTADASCRVLVVEDEGMVAMLLEDMLAELGHEVVASASRVDRAAELIEQAAFDVAVLDVNINGQWTYPLAQSLKNRGIPFIFATGYGRSGLQEEWRGAPVLQKPFQTQELDRLLREVLNRTEG
jgi:CheY-like chemotaxis protein